MGVGVVRVGRARGISWDRPLASSETPDGPGVGRGLPDGAGEQFDG